MQSFGDFYDEHDNTISVLFIGDIVGKTGRSAVSDNLPFICEKYSIDFCIANVENAAGGFGITPVVANQLFSMNIDVLTSGNHIWDKKDILPYLEDCKTLIRPANYPPLTPGYGFCIVEQTPGLQIGVLNLAGRVFGDSLDCPFRKGQQIINEMRKQTHNIIVDFHGEATSEKNAFGWYMDGKVSAVIGTHTHVQTADEKILSGGTAYLTDVGMAGAYESVIGTKKEDALQRFLTQRPNRFRVASGPRLLNACVIQIDITSGKALQITRLSYGPS